MPKFYVTFGQNHVHPRTGERMKDFWIEIYAESYTHASNIVTYVWGNQWSLIYERGRFDKSFFPRGNFLKERVYLGNRTLEDEADDLIEKIYEQRRNNRQAEGARNNEHKLSP